MMAGMGLPRSSEGRRPSAEVKLRHRAPRRPFARRKGTIMIDKKAFHSLSYGLYIITTQVEGFSAGCVCNTFQQVTSDPLQVSVALNKQNATTDAIRGAGRFAVSVLSQDASMELIGMFGFHSSNDTDKFAGCKVAHDDAGIPYVAEQAVARISAHVVGELDLGTHVLFVAEVDEAEELEAGEPMTYSYYHLVKGGKTPPKASSYLGADDLAPVPGAEESGATRVAWRCTICGHIEYVDELPDDFECPVCGMGKEMFEKIEVPA